ncbi:MAG: cytochrome C oxidase subunit IV family protein [Dechloromonas sp.]|nr:cytochrome C oxidase subunit IV family protein [Dechloromonas sp.]HNI83014.1 cytochrome C oxidase subunit IV family protein [Rhodocyclaceae bacterium]
MNAFLKNPAHRAWLVLLVATGITWYLGEAGAAGTGAIVAMLAIAFVKGRLVILDFMELRGAPLLWRVVLEGWLILVSSLILLAYWLSLK